ncbi:MAG: hypothetical protein WKG07_25665 [Hymenobacter sp.]
MPLPYRRLVVKIGSNVLTQPNGLPDEARMAQLVSQLVDLKRQGREVILVSSGAVAAGRSLITLPPRRRRAQPPAAGRRGPSESY